MSRRTGSSIESARPAQAALRSIRSVAVTDCVALGAVQVGTETDPDGGSTAAPSSATASGPDELRDALRADAKDRADVAHRQPV